MYVCELTRGDHPGCPTQTNGARRYASGNTLSRQLASTPAPSASSVVIRAVGVAHASCINAQKEKRDRKVPAYPRVIMSLFRDVQDISCSCR